MLATHKKYMYFAVIQYYKYSLRRSQRNHTNFYIRNRR